MNYGYASFQYVSLNSTPDWLFNTIFLSGKGWNSDTMSEVRELYKNDFSTIFPKLNYVKMTWSVYFTALQVCPNITDLNL